MRWYAPPPPTLPCTAAHCSAPACLPPRSAQPRPATPLLQVVAATPFSDESHTGDAIEASTEAALDRSEVGGLNHERLFFPVSDNGANMVAGWEAFGGGRCGVHTGQLSAKVFLDHPEIKPTRDKEKGITAHFNKSTGLDGLNGLHKCQRAVNLPEHAPPRPCW